MRISKTTACLIAAAGGVILLGCPLEAPPLDENPTAGAISGDHAGTGKIVHGIGYVEPVSEVHGLSFKTGGVIARCSARVGNSVNEGDTLMVLDYALEQKAVAVAEAELEVARADHARVLSGVNEFQIRAAERAVEMWTERVDFATKEAVRFRELVEEHAVSRSEYDEAETSLQQALAQFRRAQAELEYQKNFVTKEDRQLAEANVTLARRRLELAKQKLADTRLAAPFDGTVFEILHREGEAVSTIYPEPVILLGDTTHLRVRAEIDERYVARVSEGQTALISGRGLGDRSFQGRIVLVKKIMGKKTVFSGAASERKDLDVVEVLIEIDEDFSAPVGLRVDVRVDVGLDTKGT